jgi:hypothetical protein
MYAVSVRDGRPTNLAIVAKEMSVGTGVDPTTQLAAPRRVWRGLHRRAGYGMALARPGSALGWTSSSTQRVAAGRGAAKRASTSLRRNKRGAALADLGGSRTGRHGRSPARQVAPVRTGNDRGDRGPRITGLDCPGWRITDGRDVTRSIEVNLQGGRRRGGLRWQRHVPATSDAYRTPYRLLDRGPFRSTPISSYPT